MRMPKERLASRLKQSADRNDTLRERIAKLKGTSATLRDENRDLQERIADIHRELLGKTRELTDSQAELKAQFDNIRRGDETLGRLRSRLEAATNNAQQMGSRWANMEGEVARTRKENQEMRIQFERERGAVARKEGEKLAIESRLAMQRRESDGLRREVARLREDAANQEVTWVRDGSEMSHPDRVAELEARIKAQANSFDRAAAKLREDNRKQTLLIQQLRSRTQTPRQVQQLKADIVQLRQQLRQTQHKAKGASVSELPISSASAPSHLSDTVKKVQAEVHQLRDDNAALQEALDLSKKKEQEAQDHVVEMESRLVVAEADIKKLKKGKSEALAQLQMEQKMHGRAFAQSQKLEKWAKTLHATLDSVNRGQRILNEHEWPNPTFGKWEKRMKKQQPLPAQHWIRIASEDQVRPLCVLRPPIRAIHRRPIKRRWGARRTRRHLRTGKIRRQCKAKPRMTRRTPLRLWAKKGRMRHPWRRQTRPQCPLSRRRACH